MGRFLATVLLLLLASTVARADECAVHAADIIRESGATLMAQNEYNISLKLAGFREVSIDCWPQAALNVTVALGFPPDAFFTFVGEAGHLVTGLPAASLKAGAIKCQRASLAAGHDAQKEINFDGANFVCDSGAAADGTGSTTISVMKSTAASPAPPWVVPGQ